MRCSTPTGQELADPRGLFFCAELSNFNQTSIKLQQSSSFRQHYNNIGINVFALAKIQRPLPFEPKSSWGRRSGKSIWPPSLEVSCTLPFRYQYPLHFFTVLEVLIELPSSLAHPHQVPSASKALRQIARRRAPSKLDKHIRSKHSPPSSIIAQAQARARAHRASTRDIYCNGPSRGYCIEPDRKIWLNGLTATHQSLDLPLFHHQRRKGDLKCCPSFIFSV